MKRVLPHISLFFGLLASTLTASERPNVLLVVADDLGIGMLSHYGQQIVTTPHIDRLAAEGIQFTNYHGGAYCAPARWSLLNGLHDGRRGAGSHSPGNFIVQLDRHQPKLGETEWQRRYDTHIEARSQAAPIPDDALLLGQVAQLAGYRTAQFGKLDTGFLTWHERVTRHGWDHYVGYYDHARAHGFYPPYLWKNGKKLPLEGNPHANAGKRGEHGCEPVGTAGSTYSQDVFLREILAYLRDHKENHPDRNFFLYHSTQLPHGPVSINQLHPDYEHRNDLTLSEKKYASMVKLLDDHVGIIRRELEALGLAGNTMIFFTSDNGHETYYANRRGFLPKQRKNKLLDGSRADFERNKWRTSNGGDTFNGAAGMADLKWSAFQGGIRCPMIVHMPRRIRAGSSTDRLTTHYDFLPTLAQIVGLKDERLQNKDGLSYLPTLLGKPGPTHDWIFVRGGRHMQGVVIDKNGWKFCQFKNGQHQLYSLRENHLEERNVIQRHPEIANHLHRIFQAELDSEPPKRRKQETTCLDGF